MATAPQRAAARPGQRPAGSGAKPTTPKGKTFTYHDDDDPSVVSQHATAPSGAWDSFIKSGIPMFRPKVGLHSIRILPRTFDYKSLSEKWAFTVDPHWGLKIFVHSPIGPDKATYLCRRLMLGESCALCNERQLSAGDPKALKDLAVKTRYIAWLLDRKNISVGPQIWNMPPAQVEQEICKRQEDRDTHQIIKIEHPLRGYDVEFEGKEQGDYTVWTGVNIKRSPSPITDDPALFAFDEKSRVMSGKWAEIIHETPLDQALRWYDDAYLLQIYNGEAQRDDTDAAEDVAEANTAPVTIETGAAEIGEEEAAGEEQVEQTTEYPPPEVIVVMDEAELTDLCSQFDMGFNMADYDNDIEVARDAVIGEFHPDWVWPEPEPEPEPPVVETRRPGPARRPGQAAPTSQAKPAAPAPAKPTNVVPKSAASSTNSGGTTAQQATARLAAMRAKNAAQVGKGK